MPDTALFGRNLTQLARAQRLDPVVGRDDELDSMLRVLCRRTKNNPLLLGAPGVGKTALVEGLAQRMAAQKVPTPLRDRELFELQLGPLLAGTQYRGDLEKRLQDFLKRAHQERVLVFIDEIHLLVVAGRGSGMDAGNLLKPILARGEIPCIGATTPREAEEMFKTDPAMERRFQTIFVPEPREHTVRSILLALRPRLETHHGLGISDEAIDEAVRLSMVLPTARNNPDRAIDLLEDACAAVHLQVLQASAAPVATSAARGQLQSDVARAAQDLDVERHALARAALEHFEREAGWETELHLRASRLISRGDVAAVATRAGPT
jgi:ATP-dependent Clp protease ATP-binding subunit ClpB